MADATPAASAGGIGQPAGTRATRDASVDVMRGVVIVLMALDHVRIFFTAAAFDPLDLTQTSPGLFLIRWVTHLCAPAFFALAGLSVWLQHARGVSRNELARWLVIRGLWLIALEVTVFGFAWSFTPGWRWLGVIWGLGAAMLLLAAGLYVPRRALLALGGGFALVHSLLIPQYIGSAPVALYAPGFVEVAVLGRMLVIYPVLPWAALMLVGYAAGAWLYPHGAPRRRRLVATGIIALVAFVVLRVLGLGDPSDQAPAPDSPTWQHLAVFVDVDKYPPSTLYALLMLGLATLLLAAFAGRPGKASSMRWLATFGSVPFFFYLLHLFVIHGLALLVASSLDRPRAHLFWHDPDPQMLPAPGYGLEVAGLLATWVIVVALLYPACAAFARFKRRRGDAWLRLF